MIQSNATSHPHESRLGGNASAETLPFFIFPLLNRVYFLSGILSNFLAIGWILFRCLLDDDSRPRTKSMCVHSTRLTEGSLALPNRLHCLFLPFHQGLQLELDRLFRVKLGGVERRGSIQSNLLQMLESTGMEPETISILNSNLGDLERAETNIEVEVEQGWLVVNGGVAITPLNAYEVSN